MKRRSIVVSSAASYDQANIVSYLGSVEGLEIALQTDQKLDQAMRSLTTLSQRGRVVPELKQRGITGYRELIEFPYRIIYRIVRSEVWILAVIDGRRDLSEVLFTRVQQERVGDW